MGNGITEPALREAEHQLRQLDKINKFTSRYDFRPSEESAKLAKSMQILAGNLPKIDNPQDQDELLLSELKRRIGGEASFLEQQFSGALYDFETVRKIYGIPQEDLDALEPWLRKNKDKAKEAVKRLFRSHDIEGHELEIASDIPSVREQAEQFAGAHISKYHSTLSKFLEGLTGIGKFLHHVSAVPTTKNRSYFNPFTSRLAIGISAICYSNEDGTLAIRDRELIRLFGHEGMGHGLNHVLSHSDGLPFFLTQNSALTIATEESIAQFYEQVLLEDLKQHPEIQRKLGIEHRFGEIYQEAKDVNFLKNFQSNLGYYAVLLLADKTLGDPQDPEVLKRKIEMVRDVALTPSGIAAWMSDKRKSYDLEGNLSTELTTELRYCAQPVQRALGLFNNSGILYENGGRNLIDRTILSGFWTPQGFVDNARLRATEATKK
jgi:hypothetical protein